ncbi:hypothetical protein AHAS_Ahas03G0003600 [Arachis hypogaea]
MLRYLQNFKAKTLLHKFIAVLLRKSTCLLDSDTGEPPQNIRAWLKFVTACCLIRSKQPAFSVVEAEELIESIICLFLDRQFQGFEHQILRAIFSFEIRVQNDILKRLYHTEDAPQDMMEMRAEIVAMLKSLSLHPYVQELKANKEELRVEKLKDKGRLEKALVEEEGKGKGLRCFGGITAVFSNFGSGCGSLGNVKADEVFEDTVAVVA